MTAPARARLGAVDTVRGFVIALMALDHTRDFFCRLGRPTDLATTTVPLFLTRWVTHFCAPTFVLLAGVAAFLQGQRMPSRGALSWHLLTRGLWLVLLELTVVRLGWDLRPLRPFVLLQVIWALGLSMVALAALHWLPRWALAAFSLALIALHNRFDAFDPHTALWTVLHAPHALHPTRALTVYAAYPLVPWVGVLCLGYVLGPWFLEPALLRRRLLLAGLGATLGFVLLRYANVYGDPTPWSPQRSPAFTVLSFLNCTKYPPSLAYLLMTLGPTLLALAWLDGPTRRFARPFETLGRVPLFFYLLHLPLLQVGAGLVLLARVGPGRFTAALAHGEASSFGLPGVYLAWLAALALLYPLCALYAERKRTRPSPWMRWL